MSERLSTAEAAQALGVHVNTVKHWIGQVQIPAEKDNAGRWRFSPEALEVLQAIKELRGQDRSFETIRRRIDKRPLGDRQAGEQPELSDRLAGDKQPPSLDPHALAETLTTAITPQIVDALASQTSLAEKYAKAAHQIGRLEAEVEYLKTRLGEAREENGQLADKVRLLEAPKSQRPWWRLW